jgi:hypothetical protein
MRRNGYMGKTKAHFDIDNHAPYRKGRFLLRCTEEEQSVVGEAASYAHREKRTLIDNRNLVNQKCLVLGYIN